MAISALTNHDKTKARKIKNETAKARNLEMKEITEEMKVVYEGITLRGLADILNKAGYSTSRGNEWQPTNVNHVINI